ncbi:hypothetical protein [Streptomyces avidinii]|uniref:Uncharacterized protein n=1 Tax=Streptomyces avidinii TaxID=1895 RepID=A0ABS4L916_STRAV|nr:hypothetical protein [Streptomyces avidinii]MBP2038587.1 hypothetical protein [Streptomyces avidinii]GGZ23685.1 hypothetical protein GCM10010343_58610 [Streptomyces avidinii]
MQRLMQTLEVMPDEVRRGDVIAVGGIPHRVRDVRELRGRRKRLEFEDGNVFVLGPWVAIKVSRDRNTGGGPVRHRR